MAAAMAAPTVHPGVKRTCEEAIVPTRKVQHHVCFAGGPSTLSLHLPGHNVTVSYIQNGFLSQTCPCPGEKSTNICICLFRTDSAPWKKTALPLFPLLFAPKIQHYLFQLNWSLMTIHLIYKAAALVIFFQYHGEKGIHWKLFHCCLNQTDRSLSSDFINPDWRNESKHPLRNRRILSVNVLPWYTKTNKYRTLLQPNKVFYCRF